MPHATAQAHFTYLAGKDGGRVCTLDTLLTLVSWGNSHQNRVNGCKGIEDGDRAGARHAK